MVKLKLNKDGQTIRLTSINQARTYEGMLEGPPDAEFNAHMIDGWLRSRGSPAIVVRPTARPAHFGGGPHLQLPDTLPPIEVTARFASHSAVATGDPDDIILGSYLWVLWFQDDWAMPIDPSVLAHLSEIDWNEEAANSVF